jgi:hypothetical protein
MNRIKINKTKFVYSIINKLIKVMSTTFGVKIPTTGEIIPIARRVGIGNGKVRLSWLTDIAELLPNDLKVIAIDNSNQGINCIGDIKSHIKEQEDNE